MASARSSLRSGPEASLDDVLAAREIRAERRASLLHAAGVPIVTVTTVMPGPVKDCELARIPFAAALVAIETLASRAGWTRSVRHRATPVTGPEAFVAVDADAVELKRALVALEETHPLGRLFDLDVTGVDGASIGRAELGLAPRRCLLCDRPAKQCGRARTHPLEELFTRMEDRIDAWLVPPA